jgi:peptide deformylase
LKTSHVAAALAGLRSQPQWSLIAANDAPVIIAMLRVLLFDRAEPLPSSQFLEQLSRHLEDVRAAGYDMSRSPSAYANEWVRNGYLVRRMPANRHDGMEEIYELTPEAGNAIRFVNGLERPRAFATESRLASVINQMTRLAEETDANPHSRISALMSERERIDRELDAIRAGQIRTLSDERAVERAREVLGQAEALIGDFRRVREAFERLSRDIRQQLLSESENRAEVLDAFFRGLDLIAESPDGKAFDGLWRLLNEPQQRALFEEALDAIIHRSFTRRLDEDDRRALRNLLGRLLKEASSSNNVMLSLSRSLRSFVQSKEYIEHRRMTDLLRAANTAAMAALEHVKPWTRIMGYQFTRTSADVHSLDSYNLLNPRLRAANTDMALAEESDVSMADVAEQMRRAEIDLVALERDVRTVVSEASPATVSEVLKRFPARQGLGTIAGLLSLSNRFGFEAPGTEVVSWTANGLTRSARIPLIYFVKERVNTHARRSE